MKPATPPSRRDNPADHESGLDAGYDETGLNEGEEGPDALLRSRHARVRRQLPADGEADRPTRPRVGVDLMYPGDGIVGQAGAALSFGLVGEDMFLHLVLSTVIAGDEWAVAPRLPIRFRLVDNSPKTRWILREEDWDEVSDFARLLAFFQWGHVGDPFYLRVGELPGVSVGHGTIVNRYYNTIDIDHYQGGLYTHLDLDVAGGEALLDNLFDPEVAVARGFMRPLQLVDADLPYFARNMKIGVTLGADFRAPTRVATHPLTQAILADDDFHAIVIDRSIVPLMGADLEVPVWSSPHFDMVPYVDINSVDANSVGVHFGSFFNVRFDTLTEWRTRLEYRYSGSGYDPDYVSPFYEIHRLRYRNDETKLAWLRAGWDGGRHGFYGESELRLIGTMRLTMVFSRDQGPPGEPADTDLALRLRFPQIGPVGLTFFFARMDFDGIDDFLDPTNTVFAVSARYNVLDLFYVQARVVNEWWLKHSTSGATGFETTTDFDIGVGLLLNI